MPLNEYQYNRLATFKPFLRLSVELGTGVSNKHNEELNTFYMELGNPPADLYCSGCISEMFKFLYEAIQEYERRKPI